MRCRTRLNANQARWQRSKEPQDVGSPQPLANDNRAVVVDTVNLKDILCDIEADPDRGHGDLPLNNNAVPPILSEPGSAVAEGVHPIWIRTSSSAMCPYPPVRGRLGVPGVVSWNAKIRAARPN